MPTNALLAASACLLAVLSDRWGLIYNWARTPTENGRAMFDVLQVHRARGARLL